MKIPIEFLINRMGLRIEIVERDYFKTIYVSRPSKKLLGSYTLSKDQLAQQRLTGVYYYGDVPVDILTHYIVNVLNSMFPDFHKLPIDYSGLKNYI